MDPICSLSKNIFLNCERYFKSDDISLSERMLVSVSDLFRVVPEIKQEPVLFITLQCIPLPIFVTTKAAPVGIGKPTICKGQTKLSGQMRSHYCQTLSGKDIYKENW